jgi:hypothetical protein
VARRKLNDAERAEKNRKHYEAYVKIMADCDRMAEEQERLSRPSAIIIRFPLERMGAKGKREAARWSLSSPRPEQR